MKENEEMINNLPEEQLPEQQPAAEEVRKACTGESVDAAAEKAPSLEEELSCAARNYSGPCKKTSIGGQALLEGIMMRGPKKTAMAVRRPDGGIELEYLDPKSIKDKSKILSAPIIRGVVGYVESMLFGYKALMRSAELSFDEEAESRDEKQSCETSDGVTETVTEPQAEETAKECLEADAACELSEAAESAEKAACEHQEADAVPAEPAKETEKEKKDSGEIGKGTMTLIGILGVVLAVGLAIFLFMWLPAVLFDLFNGITEYDFTRFKGLFENTLKILLLVGYMAAVSLMKDIRRTFMYHGAEHKTIACYEAGKPLTVENCRQMRRYHPRCGTSFLILMLLLSILVSTLIILVFPGLADHRLLWVAIKILLIPVVCGLGYELIKFCGRHDNLLTRIISAPGMWLQRLTTKEPTDKMLEVAIFALTAVIPERDQEDKW